MKKSIAILVVLLVAFSAFAGNGKPLKKAPKKLSPSERIELITIPANKKIVKPVPKSKKAIVAKPMKKNKKSFT